MSSETAALQETPPERVVIELRLEQDYNAFMREGKISPTLSGLAKAINISAADISLLSIRSGCTIVVMALPKEVADRLLKSGIVAAEVEGLTAEELEQLNKVVKFRRGGIVEAPYISNIPHIEPDISWLHLSDLHIKDDYTNPESDTNADLGRFLEDLPRLLNGEGIRPNAVFFTGDVAHSGSEAQYEAAEIFFNDIRNCLPVDSKDAPFLAIPGNHDVSWLDIEPDSERKMRNRLKAGESYETLIPDFSDHVEKRHHNFVGFSHRFHGSACQWLDHNSFAHLFTLEGKSVEIGVAGFNSAWLSTRKDLFNDKGFDESVADLDLQHLVLGKKQIRNAKAKLKGSHLRIALVHHEPMSQWYRDDDRQLQRQEMKFFDFVLRGHQHEPQARQGVKVAGRDDYMELAPGALRTWPHYFQGFMAVELDFTAKWMRLTAWTVTGQSRDWVLDQQFGDRGVHKLPIPQQLRDRLSGG